MDLKCKLVEKSFKSDDGQSHSYYVLEFVLFDGSTLDISVKSDKAKLLLLSSKVR